MESMIVKLCDVHDLPAPGEMRSFRGRDLELCLARTQSDPGRLFVFDNRCPHQHAPLSAGCLDGDMVVCPYHSWKFNVTTGAPDHEGDPPLATYEARQYDDEIFVRIP
jgi:nitrite reductase (NADH) small subunit